VGSICRQCAHSIAMLETILNFQIFLTVTGDIILLVLAGAWFLLHPTELRHLRLLWQTQAPALDQYLQVLRNHLLLSALEEAFLCVNWWITYPVEILWWLGRHRHTTRSWFASRFLRALPILTGLPLAICVSLAFVTRDCATLITAGALTLVATSRLMALLSASNRW
jgi:hypothetical protein